MKKYLSLQVWSMSEVALVIFLAAILLASTAAFSSAIFNLNGAIAGIFGALVLRHLALHGWTLQSGNIGQRVVLFVLWLIAVVIGRTLVALIGF